MSGVSAPQPENPEEALESSEARVASPAPRACLPPLARPLPVARDACGIFRPSGYSMSVATHLFRPVIEPLVSVPSVEFPVNSTVSTTRAVMLVEEPPAYFTALPGR